MKFYKNMQSSLSKHARAVGEFVVVLYVICLLWKFLNTDPEIASFHLNALKLALPGFKGFDVLSILWGGVLSFVYGYAASRVFHWLHRDCCELKK